MAAVEQLERQAGAGDESAFQHLVERAQQGDRRALSSVFELSRPAIQRIVRQFVRPDAVEDVLHDVYLRLRKNIGKYRASHSDSFGAWLLVVARNTAFDFLRSELRAGGASTPISLPLGDAESEAVVSAAVSRESATVDQDTMLAVREALDHLSAREREAVILFYFVGLSYKRIAERLAVSEGTVRTFLARARSKLRENFESARDM